ncbi:hypothetical protein HMF7854_08055 [Sphingomonas ginkgonis]|uniref:Uncharacterized protein n=1 Tax=Sphingomonas ginkgonis TaxID=2315330 RepID=A0A429VA51_9SPHN|nr:hypothetical protein [Sphingomonas ginkgonis]RST30796.1 hypothetical protein HMF7854_08055 [Sphingomonas ginkgonis]
MILRVAGYVGAAALLVSGAVASAQMTPGAEIVGQSVQVTEGGVTNTVMLQPGGTAQIMSPGGTTVNGTWSVANGQLCLGANGAQECYPYAQPFQAGQPQTVTSSCGASATWLASNINQPPSSRPAGERG